LAKTTGYSNIKQEASIKLSRFEGK